MLVAIEFSAMNWIHLYLPLSYMHACEIEFYPRNWIHLHFCFIQETGNISICFLPCSNEIQWLCLLFVAPAIKHNPATLSRNWTYLLQYWNAGKRLQTCWSHSVAFVLRKNFNPHSLLHCFEKRASLWHRLTWQLTNCRSNNVCTV